MSLDEFRHGPASSLSMSEGDLLRKCSEPFPWQFAEWISRESFHEVQRPRKKQGVDAFSQFRLYRGRSDAGSDDEGGQSAVRTSAWVRPVERPIHYTVDLGQRRIQSR
jgi:hypothetical protein